MLKATDEFPLGGSVCEPYDIDREAKLMDETIEPIKIYTLCIKSNTDAPDFEISVEAVSVQDAVEKIKENYDLDDSIIKSNLSY